MMADLGWIEIVDWERFQHYDPEKRSPPWIKIYLELHHDDSFLRLSGDQRAILLGLWLEYAATRSRPHADDVSTPSRHRLEHVPTTCRHALAYSSAQSQSHDETARSA